MGPKKKKVPKNAFYFFMVDWKREQEQMGMRFPGGLKEVANLCDEEWKNLPEERAEIYKNKARLAKEQDQNDLANKYTSLGKSYKELYAEKEEAAAAAEQMEQEIRNTLHNISRTQTALTSHRFYLIHANYYCYYREKNIFIPCEVAISEFTLGEGFKNSMHLFPGIVYPKQGEIPLGYLSDCLDHKNKTHNIDCPEPPNPEYDCEEIDKKIRKFLLPAGGSELPPLYTMPDNGNTYTSMTTVKNFFENIAYMNRTENEYRVYALPALFKALLDACVEKRKEIDPDFEEEVVFTPVLAAAQLERDVYNFTPGLACNFHEGEESMQYCSLSWVKRWVFLICYFCCRTLHIDFIPGQHCPVSAKTPSYVEQDQKRQSQASKPSQSLGAIPRRPTTTTCNENEGAWAPVRSSRRTPVDTVSEGMRGVQLQDTWRASRENVQPGRNPSATQEITFIDHSKVVDPSKQRVYKLGQSPNVISEVMPGAQEEYKSLRQPKGPGRGEMLAHLLQQTQGPSFTNEDFPSIGGRRAPPQDDFPALGSTSSTRGRLSKPLVSAWGRGFSSGQ